MIIGAIIPVCVYEMSKQKCFENWKNKASQFVSDMTQKCNCMKTDNASKSNEA